MAPVNVGSASARGASSEEAALSQSPSVKPPADRVSSPVVVAFASAGIPTAIIGLLLAIYMPRFYAGHIGLPLAAVGLAFTTVRILDIGLDPILGAVMDRTHTRLGRYRPWLAASIPIQMLAIWLLLNPAGGATSLYLTGWLLLLYAGVSVGTLSQAAWAGALATDYHDRSRVYGWMQAVAVIGTMAILLLPLYTRGAITPGKAESMRALAMIMMVVIPAGTLAAVVLTPERTTVAPATGAIAWRDYWDAVRRPTMLRIIIADLFLALGPGTLLPIYIFFFKDVKGFTVAQANILLVPLVAASLIGSPFAALVAKRFGKHRTLMAATFAFAIAQTILMVIPRGTLGLTALGMLLVGFTSAGFTPLLRAMVADVADEVRLEQRKEQLGLMYAMVTSTSKIGAAVSVTIVFTILQLVGYRAEDSAVNTPQAIEGLAMCYLFAPIILVVIGGAALWGYSLDEKRHAGIRDALQARDGAPPSI